MNRLFTILALALLTVSTAHGEGLDSLQQVVQAGDSCMQQYNTFEALKYYQRAFEMQNTQAIRIKLADCYYQRANYRQAAELLKLIPEDSLSHDAFRQLAYSYQKQEDNASFVYWAGQLVGRFPMDGEVVAGLILAHARANQPQNGIECGLEYFQKDSTNILVNRAIADAYFMNRQFDNAVKMYERLLQLGDSTFNTLYSAGLSYSMIKELDRAYPYLRDAFILSQMQHANCAWRLGVVCIDTKRFEEGLSCLDLATQLLLPDTTTMKAITLSRGEGYYLTEHYSEAIAAWKEHLAYNPTSIATYFNVANTYALLLEDKEQAKPYYQQFLDLARKEENPTTALQEMMKRAEAMLSVP